MAKRGALDLAAAILGIAAVGLVDYASGLELRVYPFYFAPIALGARDGSTRRAIALAALAAFSWVLCNVAVHAERLAQPWIWSWNAIVQTAAFVFVAVLLADLRKRLANERALGRVDPLTDLVNFRGYRERAQLLLALARRNGRPITFVCIDLDHFKEVNDKSGHAEGDRALSIVASVLKAQSRTTDVVARIGGDEFAVVLPETDSGGAQIALERTRNALAIAMKEHGWPITMSAGAVVFSKNPPELDDALRQADALMYSVKSGGRDAVHVALVDSPATSIPPRRKTRARAV